MNTFAFYGGTLIFNKIDSTFFYLDTCYDIKKFA